jgi:hypothetical protein
MTDRDLPPGRGGTGTSGASPSGESRGANQDALSRRGGLLLALPLGALVVAIAMGLIIGAAAMISSIRADDTAAPPVVPALPTMTVTVQPEGAPAPTTASTLDGCRQAEAQLAGALRAAAPGLDQWAVHIGAMNKLVVGAITLRQATAFWNQTRVGAARNVQGFFTAVRRVPDVRRECPAPGASAQAGATVRACARHVAAQQRALDAAGTSLGTWRSHFHDMEMLRLGRMSPGTATRMWLASWQQGDRELRAYRAAARAADRAGPC